MQKIFVVKRPITNLSFETIWKNLDEVISLLNEFNNLTIESYAQNGDM
jgi:hypothetical protein